MKQDELTIELPDQKRLRTQNESRSNVREFAQHASQVAERAIQEARIPDVGDEVLRQGSRRPSSRYLPPGEVLPQKQFLKQLQREKRRTDRTKLPLSIALFHFSDKSGELSNVRKLLDLLSISKRETDFLGYLREDLIAVLLPDTNEQGARGFMQRIVDRSDVLPLTITRTYPDPIFENLITENQNIWDSHLVLLDDSADHRESAYLLKRGLDIFGSIAAILLLSPVMLIAALAVAMTSPGPVIYKQIRLGKRGVPFVFYKFRSMYCNVDDRIHREYVKSLIKGNLEEVNQGDASKPYYKIRSDPRVTRVGHAIREASIDELPQLFNVLKGDMSLVGPRPPLPYEAENYESWHLRRILEIKPGITGLWQVEGHSTTTFDEMVRIDLRYMRSCSLMLDLRILLKTAKIVLKCAGAT